MKRQVCALGLSALTRRSFPFDFSLKGTKTKIKSDPLYHNNIITSIMNRHRSTALRLSVKAGTHITNVDPIKNTIWL